METLKITYQGTIYKNHSEVPFDKEDQKILKQISNWGKPGRPCKDIRADNIQHCYAIILKKGLNSPKLPDKRWLTYEDLRPLAAWLEIGSKSADGFLEPLRIAKTIYLETYNNDKI